MITFYLHESLVGHADDRAEIIQESSVLVRARANLEVLVIDVPAYTNQY